MEGVVTFVASFKEYPPRSVPPSFNPTNMLEDTLREIETKRKLERAFPMLAPTVSGAPAKKRTADVICSPRRDHVIAPRFNSARRRRPTWSRVMATSDPFAHSVRVDSAL